MFVKQLIIAYLRTIQSLITIRAISSFTASWVAISVFYNRNFDHNNNKHMSPAPNGFRQINIILLLVYCCHFWKVYTYNQTGVYRVFTFFINNTLII